MNQLRIAASRVINASLADIYAVMSDYRVGHPAVLPKPYFSKLVVVQGGRGAGTEIEVHMEVFGSKRVFHQIVSEPEPGHRLVETDTAAGVATSFTVDPDDGGRQTRVTISTESRLSPGLQGVIERLFNPLIIRRIYREELELLDAYMRRGSRSAVPPQAGEIVP